MTALPIVAASRFGKRHSVEEAEGVQLAMRHSSPEAKRRYQLGLIHQVREHLERANEKTYQGRDPLHFRDSRVPAEVSRITEVCN